MNSTKKICEQCGKQWVRSHKVCKPSKIQPTNQTTNQPTKQTTNEPVLRIGLIQAIYEENQYQTETIET